MISSVMDMEEQQFYSVQSNGNVSSLILKKIGASFSKLPTDTDQSLNYGNKKDFVRGVAKVVGVNVQGSFYEEGMPGG